MYSLAVVESRLETSLATELGFHLVGDLYIFRWKLGVSFGLFFKKRQCVIPDRDIP